MVTAQLRDDGSKGTIVYGYSSVRVIMSQTQIEERPPRGQPEMKGAEAPCPPARSLNAAADLLASSEDDPHVLPAHRHEMPGAAVRFQRVRALPLSHDDLLSVGV